MNISPIFVTHLKTLNPMSSLYKFRSIGLLVGIFPFIAVYCFAQFELGAGQEVPPDGGMGPVAWCGDFIMLARPSDEDRFDLWAQMPGQRGEFRIAHTLFPDNKTTTRRCSCAPGLGLISPDAKWVAFDQKFCTHFSVAYVLHRDEAHGFVPLPKLVSESGWDLFHKQNTHWKRERMSGISDIGGSICDLVAWEPDGSGVWFSLRGGDEKGKGIYHWYFLWDARNQKALTPGRVKTINQHAPARWNSDKYNFDKQWAAAEEQHVLFLALLEWRIAHPADQWDEVMTQRLLMQWRDALVVDPIQIKKMGTPNAESALKASIAKSSIEKHRNSLFQASFRMGAAAPRDDHPR